MFAHSVHLAAATSKVAAAAVVTRWTMSEQSENKCRAAVAVVYRNSTCTRLLFSRHFIIVQYTHSVSLVVSWGL